MIWQFGRLHFDQIGFDVFDDSIAHPIGQKIDNCGVNFRRGSKRPPFLAALIHDLCNLVGELFVNATIGLDVELRPLRD